MKKIKRPKDYDTLVTSSVKQFGNLPPTFKFFYFDQDQDLITISNQDDLDEALDMPQSDNIKMYIEQDIERAKDAIATN